MALITYLDKDKDIPDTEIRGQWRAIDANEVKSVVNANQNALPAAIEAAVDAAVDALVTGAPAALDTLNELAAAMGDDPNFAASMATELALKAPLLSPVFTGTPSLPTGATGITQTNGDNSNKLATTEYADAKVADAINNAVTDIAPSQNAVFDGLALKQDTLVSGTTIKQVQGVSLLGSGNIVLIDDAIVDGEAKAPSQNAVFDALALKATTQYVDDAVAAAALGLTFKTVAAAVATTANITLSGEQTIDGVLTSASRVLVKNQTTKSQNGIYVSAAGSWSRSTDADIAAELENAAINVTGGGQALSNWWQVTRNITLGGSDIVWVSLGTTVADATASVKGISRLYTSTGSNTDGSMDQNSITQALALKANLASPTFTGTVAGITKTMVGLGSVDNTADTAKPVSTAQQTALNAKQATLVSGTNIKTINGTSILGSGDIATTSEVANIGLTAVGNGIADDRAAIQNAYDAAYTAGYRSFYLPAGTYLMSLSTGVGIYACLFIKPGTTLFGDGDDTVIKRHSSHLLGVTITYDKTSHNAANLADRNYHLSKFRILGTTGRGYESPIGSSETEGGIFLATAANRCNKVVIEHVRCETLNKESIAVWDAVEATVRWNRVYNCNFDAYNPQLCDSLILTGNYAHGCNIGCEYEGKRTGGVPTHALISNNEFVNIYEYGIGVEAGDNVKITGNLLVGQLGSATETFQAIGVYILPNQGNIDTLEITNNQIINFIQAGVSNSVPVTGDYVLSNLIIKGNTFAKNGENCIRLKAFSKSKILHTDIGDNTFRDWNRIDNGTSVQWSAIHIEQMDDVSIHNNNSRNIVNGKRNDPLFIKDTSNVRFYDNDVTGPPSEFNSILEIKQQGTNTGLISFNNAGLSGVADPTSLKANLISPALVTPNLGTPSAGVLTNATGLPLTTGVTSILQIANGGTGTATGISSATQNSLNLKKEANHFAKRITPTGVQNGENTIFTVPHVIELDSEEFFRNGLLQSVPQGYTISGQTLTLASAPESWEILRINYIRT